MRATSRRASTTPWGVGVRPRRPLSERRNIYMSVKRSKGQVVAAVQQLSTATAKHLASGTQVSFMGSSFTPDQITTKLQSVVTLRNNVNAARSSLKAALAAEATQMPDLRSFIAAYESYVKVTFGASVDVLDDFGLAPKKRTPPTAETTITAVKKRASTR